MQIESLKVFCDLAETESFTKAAQINAVTQSAVSQQISSLERIFKSLLIVLLLHHGLLIFPLQLGPEIGQILPS